MNKIGAKQKKLYLNLKTNTHKIFFYYYDYRMTDNTFDIASNLMYVLDAYNQIACS